MKMMIMLLLFSVSALAENYRPGMEYRGVVEDVSGNTVRIDGHYYNVPGGTLIKRGKGKQEVTYQIKEGDVVLFAIQPDKRGKLSDTLRSIRPMYTFLDEVQP